MRGSNLMRNHGMNPGVVTVLGKESLQRPQELVDFYVENQITYVVYNLQYRYFLANHVKVVEQYDGFLRNTLEYISGHDLPLTVRQLQWALDTVSTNKTAVPMCAHSSTPCIYNFTGIDTDGNIYPGCTRLMDVYEGEFHKFTIGNVLTVGLQEARRSLRFLQLQETVNLHRLSCAFGCESFGQCYGGCTAHFLLADGQASEQSYCTSTRRLLSLAHEHLS